MKPLPPQQAQRLQAMLVAAQKARATGLIAQAEQLLRDILKLHAEAWEAHQQLAILLASTGRSSQAVKHFRLIVKAHPAYAPGHANLANALSESGNLAEAIIEFQRALQLDHGLMGARIAMSETLRRARRFADAIRHYQTILDRDKTNHAAFNGLGLVYRDMDDIPRALECFEHAVGLSPNMAEYRVNFGSELCKHNLYSIAIEQFHQAVTLRPDWLEAIVLLGDTLQQQRRFDDAIECFQRARTLAPENPELLERMGYVYLAMGDSARALTAFNQILAAHPKRHNAQLGIGRSHMEAGHAPEAAYALEALIADYPESSSGYYYLAASRKFRTDDPLIAPMQALAAKAGTDQPSAISLNFALGKVYDDCKQWDAAWQHYALANRLKGSQAKYNREVEESRISHLISVFNSELIRNRTDLGCDSALPIVIIGMPRSGTTLTEQIISSHPDVVPAGEVVFWGAARQAIPYALATKEPYPQCVVNMTHDHAKEIAEKYIHLLNQIAGPKETPVHITDKMPHNFMHLGLIALLFPNAKIIHCTRDAMDNCLSIFFQNFSGDHPYACDLENIGHHYQQYKRLLTHWHNVFPGRILDIKYEDTIADPEYWSRKLIEHVGLEWNDACLAPHNQERVVKTASHWQVRQPIYKTSVQRWKNYEKHLGPLKDALGYQEQAPSEI